MEPRTPSPYTSLSRHPFLIFGLGPIRSHGPTIDLFFTSFTPRFNGIIQLSVVSRSPELTTLWPLTGPGPKRFWNSTDYIYLITKWNNPPTAPGGHSLVRVSFSGRHVLGGTVRTEFERLVLVLSIWSRVRTNVCMDVSNIQRGFFSSPGLTCF